MKTTRIVRFLWYLFFFQAILFVIGLILVRKSGLFSRSSVSSVIMEISLGRIRLSLNLLYTQYSFISQYLSKGVGSSEWQSRPDLGDLREVRQLNLSGILRWENCTEEFIERFVPHCQGLTRALDSKTWVSAPVLDFCPCLPPSLVGRSTLLWSTLNLKSLEDEVGLGGEWSPSDCRARQRVAIIIPYRDRKSHLNLLLSNLHPFLQRQKISYQVFVIEQDDLSSIFNKGIIMNSGFLEILRGLPKVGPHSTGDAPLHIHTTQPTITEGSKNLLNLSSSSFSTTIKSNTPSPFSNSSSLKIALDKTHSWNHTDNSTGSSHINFSSSSLSYISPSYISDTVIFDKQQTLIVPNNSTASFIGQTDQNSTSHSGILSSVNAQVSTYQQNQNLSYHVETELEKQPLQRHYVNFNQTDTKQSQQNISKAERSESLNSADDSYQATCRKLLQIPKEGEGKGGFGHFDCFTFHDVDMIPEDDRNIYTCTTTPRHIGAFVNKYRYRLPYRGIFGEVTAFTRKQFEKVNGFSTEFYGWGGEDDDMRNRVDSMNMSVVRFPRCVAKYSMIKHKRDTGNPANVYRYSF